MSDKPTVKWRCLRSDPPTEFGDYWLGRSGGNVSCNYIDPKLAAHSTGSPNGRLSEGWTHWAEMDQPAPPIKPTPFDAWWSSSTTDTRDAIRFQNITRYELAQIAFNAGLFTGGHKK